MAQLTLLGKPLPNVIRPVLKSTPSNVITTKVRISGHHLRWTWHYEGKTYRKPDKISHMRGWDKRIYRFNATTIVLNPNTMEVWQESRPYKTVRRMIFANWDRADALAREFSNFAQIAITPIPTAHPADIQSAHLVVESKPMSAVLKPYAGTAPRIGLQFDKSHRGRAELTGKESAEGGIGLDWFLLEFPEHFAKQVEIMDKFSKNLELHLSVLQSMDNGIKELTKAVKEMKK